MTLNSGTNLLSKLIMVPVAGSTEVLGSWVMPSAVRRILVQTHKGWGWIKKSGHPHVYHKMNRAVRGCRDPMRSSSLCPYLLSFSLYKDNPHTICELKDSIVREIRRITVDEFVHVNANFLRTCQDCVTTEGHHFQHLL